MTTTTTTDANVATLGTVAPTPAEAVSNPDNKSLITLYIVLYTMVYF